MSYRFATTLLIVIPLLLACSTICLAEGGVCSEPLLAPVELPEGVALGGIEADTTITCKDGSCIANVRQAYHVTNSNRAEAAAIDLLVVASTVDYGHLDVTDAQGAPLSSATATPHGWHLLVPGGSTESCVLTTEYPLPSDKALCLGWNLVALAPWGVPQGVDLRISFAQPTPLDAILSYEPSIGRFDTHALAWQMEQGQELTFYGATLLPPPLLQREQALRQTGDRVALADLSFEMARIVAPVDPDRGEVMVAAALASLQQAIVDNPTNIMAHQRLADYYLELAAAPSPRQLNYVSLAASHVEQLLALEPSTELADSLVALYDRATAIASARGDVQGALHYMDKARKVPGASPASDPETQEALVVQWALDLASRGQVIDAIDQAADVLAPGTLDAMLRYAPPFVSAATQITLSPGHRDAQITFSLYPPSADKTMARLETLAQRIRDAGVSAVLSESTEFSQRVTLRVQTDYSTLVDLQQTGDALRAVLLEDSDLTALLVALPLTTVPDTYATRTSLFAIERLYAETIDTASVSEQWESDSQFTQWRLIELSDMAPEDERLRDERDLALVVLQEQRQVWEQLPSGTLWTVDVHFDTTEPSSAPLHIAWGQTRELTITRRTVRWDKVMLACGAALGLLLGLALVLGLRRR